MWQAGDFFQSGLMENQENMGRFFASCVYRRWKWTVRFGLLIVPMLVFLSGGLILFLTPSKYESAALVEIRSGRSIEESMNLLKSSEVLKRVIEDLSLKQQFEVDHDTAVHMLRDIIGIKAVSGTQLIEISVNSTRSQLARDIALNIPESLIRMETEMASQDRAARTEKMDEVIRQASDLAAEKALPVRLMEDVHGQAPPEAGAVSELVRLRRASLMADAEVERLQVLRADLAAGSPEASPRLVIHSAPVISQSPSNPKIGPELNELILRSLISGLLVALLLPYLWELAFPEQDGRKFIAEPIDNL